MTINLERSFQWLERKAANCRLCPRMCGRQALLSRLNGTLTPRVMFIAEAPGRRGGDRTRIPLVGDLSGRNFDLFLVAAKLTRAEIFITNAVLCNPRQGERNVRPTAAEMVNCRSFLARQIELLQPPIIATLGAIALTALAGIEPHDLTLSNVGRVYDWYGRKLVPLYHPSPHVVNSRRRHAEQLADYRVLGETLRIISKGCE
ncbi:MAG: uracil-DNA glycosylase [Acidobacteriota bacterium]